MDSVYNAFVKRQIYVERFKSGETRRLLKQLKWVDKKVLQWISKLPLSPSQSQIDDVMVKIQQEYVEFYKKAYNNSRSQAKRLIVNDTKWLKKTPANVVEKNLEQLMDNADAIPFRNIRMEQWFNGLAKKRINLIRQGLLSAGTKAERISSFKKSRNISNNYTRSLNNSLLNHYLNYARSEQFQSEVVVWISILDSSTTSICMARSRKLYDARTHQPIGHSHSWGGGPGSIHFNCRSFSVPTEQSADLDEFGQTYEEWLNKQPRSTVEEVLGVKKAEMFLGGGLALGAFVVNSGEELTIEQLESQ